MRIEIARMHIDFNTTMIYVTHDQVEAMTMADKIVVSRLGSSSKWAPLWNFTTTRATCSSPASLARRL